MADGEWFKLTDISCRVFILEHAVPSSHYRSSTGLKSESLGETTDK